jgi:glutamate N-acetyltransferase/amino-acid N-acetyltransferase
MCAWTAGALGRSPEEILVCSTGRIGEVLPMEKIRKGIQAAVATMDDSAESSMRAADAILTSDTRPKVCSVEIQTRKGPVCVSGMAKGAGMIEPNMATMLAFLCTDAAVNARDLQLLLANSVQGTFNAITVDGDESTNDTVLMLANGHSSISLAPADPDWEDFASAVEGVCLDLAKKIVGDGEKITKVVEISIQGALSPADAEKAARAVGNSLLVKSSWYGNDPNWGRVMDALGYSGAELSEDSVSMSYGNPETGDAVTVYDKGTVHHSNKPEWKSIVSRRSFRILIDLGQGSETCTVWSTDLTEDYVNFNKSE